MNFKNFKNLFLAILAIGLMVFAIGCGGGNPVGPDIPEPTENSAELEYISVEPGRTLPLGLTVEMKIKYSSIYKEKMNVCGFFSFDGQKRASDSGGSYGPPVSKGAGVVSATARIDKCPNNQKSCKTNYVVVFFKKVECYYSDERCIKSVFSFPMEIIWR